ncbi:MAG: histidine phosphatase family protein, partial [Actinomycetia bacterium]|nr:histidine phosphatase family protein [Actinomycetes bacterium]
AATIAAEQGDPPKVRIDEAFAEVRYGAWTGRTLKELAGEALWTQIQSRPSTVTFPEHPDHPHESMAEVDERAWAAWLASEQAVAEESGPRALWAVVSHGDVIKAILARALGLELDRFQSIVIDPASVSIVHRHQGRTAVSGMNLRDDVYARLASAATAETGQTPAAATSEPSEQAASSPRDEIENTIGAVGGGNG